ncbi:hypothetical protein PR003_g15467 [Phytophthora rubi]|uniref:Uncharacterized protein n=1 Tax=Phytophthora rubi TaxID=129364 RepID=A0A6A3M0U4_9STRA|nr:hypothetical protein PR002_g12981 [Phytophthora rubi]KAE9024077.1 hypothetical protein PR001_g12768 [Phytophthora rubi]KAE9329799.1 hypothetical protein PR003_g15467 [Phytophthora rubi]
MLFSHAYSTRFAETEGRVTRQQFYARETHAKSVFWQDFTLDFNSNRVDFNRLHSASARLTELDPSVVVAHTAAELYYIWRAILLKYHRALANFTKSGEHDDNFFSYCSGSLDALYIRECLELKHDLTSFVEGGMLPENQFDSLKQDSYSGTDLQSPSLKKMKMEMISAVKGISAKLLDDSASTVDSILKMHKLIEHIDNRIEALKTKGICDAALERSATMYREKLLAMDAALCKET